MRLLQAAAAEEHKAAETRAAAKLHPTQPRSPLLATKDRARPEVARCLNLCAAHSLVHFCRPLCPATCTKWHQTLHSTMHRVAQHGHDSVHVWLPMHSARPWTAWPVPQQFTQPRSWTVPQGYWTQPQ